MNGQQSTLRVACVPEPPACYLSAAASSLGWQVIAPLAAGAAASCTFFIHLAAAGSAELCTFFIFLKGADCVAYCLAPSCFQDLWLLEEAAAVVLSVVCSWNGVEGLGAWSGLPHLLGACCTCCAYMLQSGFSFLTEEEVFVN